MARKDSYHDWAVSLLLDAFEANERLLVPDAVLAESYAVLRYDATFCPKHDSSNALRLFDMVNGNRTLFEIRPVAGHRDTAIETLRKYHDQSFSLVDAMTFAEIDKDDEIARVVTVDVRDFNAYRFRRAIEVVAPAA